MVAIELKTLKMQGDEVGAVCPDCGGELTDGACPDCSPKDDPESLDETEIDEEKN